MGLSGPCTAWDRALTLETQRVGNKRPSGPTSGQAAPVRRIELEGRVLGPWAACGLPSENSVEEEAARKSQVAAWCTSTAPPGHSPSLRGESAPLHERNHWKLRLGSERRETARHQLRQGHRLRESGLRAYTLGGRCGSTGLAGQLTALFSLHPERRAGAPRADPPSAPDKRLSALFLSPCVSEDPCSLEPEAPLARLGRPKALSSSHLP